MNGSDLVTKGNLLSPSKTWSVISLDQHGGRGLDDCQVIWTDGDFFGRSRNFSVSHNDTMEEQTWGEKPQYYPPEYDGGHIFTYPNNFDFSKHLVVNVNDSIEVSWTDSSSAQASILGIRCWDRTEDPMSGMFNPCPGNLSS